MIFEQYFQQYLEELNRIGYQGEDGEQMIDGLLGLYQSSGNKKTLKLAEHLWTGKEGSVSLFLWKETQEKRYLEAAKAKVGSVNLLSFRENDWKQKKQICRLLPFYTEYDVLFGGKKHLNHIVQYFRELEECGDKLQSIEQKTVVLEALAGCFCVMPEEAYDLYRYLGDSLKQKIKELLLQKNQETGLLEELGKTRIRESAVLAGTILQGCRWGILSGERYEKEGIQLLTAVELNGFYLNRFGLFPKENEQISACMKAWGELKRMERNR